MVKNISTGQINNSYNVNSNGSIELNSIKNKSIFEFAKSCDTDGNQVLEQKEITKFLEKYEGIRENALSEVYYEQKNSKGETVKKCISIKPDGSQIMYFYKNGKPAKCVYTSADNERFIMDLNNGKSRMYSNKDDSSRYQDFDLNKDNKWKFTRIAEEKPYSFRNIASEVIYRISNWDWDFNW